MNDEPDDKNKKGFAGFDAFIDDLGVDLPAASTNPSPHLKPDAKPDRSKPTPTKEKRTVLGAVLPS